MKNITYKMVQWSTPEELHQECNNWLSHLAFIMDEQRFLNELITKYTIPLISAKTYTTSLSIVRNLGKEEKELKELISRVKKHTNTIEKLLDFHSDSREKETYKETHYYLKTTVFTYTENYRKTKAALFDKIKEFMKNEPTKKIT